MDKTNNIEVKTINGQFTRNDLIKLAQSYKNSYAIKTGTRRDSNGKEITFSELYKNGLRKYEVIQTEKNSPCYVIQHIKDLPRRMAAVMNYHMKDQDILNIHKSGYDLLFSIDTQKWTLVESTTVIEHKVIDSKENADEILNLINGSEGIKFCIEENIKLIKKEPKRDVNAYDYDLINEYL